MSSTRLSLLCAALLALSVSGGCTHASAEPDGLKAELARTRQEAARERAELAVLSARLAELERRAQNLPSEQRATQAKLDQLIALNQALMARGTSSARSETKPTPPSAADWPSDATPSGAREATPTEADQLAQLRARLNAYVQGAHGGLSREQREAMRALLRPDRVLDPEDPWQALAR